MGLCYSVSNLFSTHDVLNFDIWEVTLINDDSWISVIQMTCNILFFGLQLVQGDTYCLEFDSNALYKL